ncbi:MAG: DUF6020 family protein, partial [Oscillospiraceae bacterium]|nr:DUF6020 family protein [Oscillospiraceae bacterium]
MIRFLLHIVFALLNLYSTQKIFGLHPMSLFSVGCIIVCFLLEKKALSSSKQSKTAGTVIGIIFALLTVLAHYGNFTYSSFGASVFYVLLFAAGLVFSFSIISVCVYDELDKLSVSRNGSVPGKTVLLASWAFIFLVFFVFFLAYYPGLYSPDSLWQLQQAMGDSPLSNHHPIIHTLLIRAVLNFGMMLFNGNLTSATALLSVVQMLFLSACMAYSVKTIYDIAGSIKLCAIVVLVFALVPFNIMFSFTHLKDTWFSGFFLVFCSQLAKRIFGIPDISSSFSNKVLFALSAVGTGLFRSNGLYALLLLIPFLLFALKKDRTFTLILAVCLIICFVITGPVYKALGIASIDPVEYLSVPLQQVSRVIVDGGKLSDEDYAFISEVINPSLIPSAYYARI